jgi:hypothetical protein
LSAAKVSLALKDGNYDDNLQITMINWWSKMAAAISRTIQVFHSMVHKTT